MVFVRSFFFFSSRRRHTRLQGDWSSDVCSSDLALTRLAGVLFCVDVLLDAVLLVVDAVFFVGGGRSEERRVGKEWRCRRGAEHWRGTRAGTERSGVYTRY